MSLLDNLEFIEAPVKQPKMTFEEKVDYLINEQYEILKGKVIPTHRKDALGNPISKKSWFNENKAIVIPKVGIQRIFDKPIACNSQKDFLVILDGLKNWRSDKPLNKLISNVGNKLEEAKIKRKAKA